MSKPSPTWIGLGTAIARTTKRLGVKPCAGCKARAQVLDRMIPKVWKVRRPSWIPQR